MAETDILNPFDWISAGLDFNPNPSYGMSRKMGQNQLIQRPRLGPFLSRQVGNAGHSFPLTWVATSLSIAQRVVKFYHDFKAGYFTFINPDWGGRHFVGRFTTEPEVIEVANGKFTIQNATFEEVPTARMLQYPCDWANDGHQLNVVDDFLNPLVALMQGQWTLQVAPTAPVGSLPTTPSVMEAFDGPALGTDWAQTQYVGWGFQMTFRLAPALGSINLLLDGVLVLTLDLSNGSSSFAASNVLLSVAAGTSANITMLQVPLDSHRVKVVSNGASASFGASILFPALVYLY